MALFHYCSRFVINNYYTELGRGQNGTGTNVPLLKSYVGRVGHAVYQTFALNNQT